MAALYSLKSRGDSLDSVAASGDQDEEEDYELDFESESEQTEDGDEWEEVGGSNDEDDEQDTSVMMEPHVQVNMQYFKADTMAVDGNSNSNNVAMAVDEPESEPVENERAHATEATEQVDEPRRLVISTTTTDAVNRTHLKAQPALSPSSKSRNANKALRSFYLLKAKQVEATHKLIVVRPPPPPPPQTVILPLKAPVRYPIAAQEEAIQAENARKAKLALQQFYLARAMDKQTRAALNRSNEAKLIQSQSGRGVLLCEVSQSGQQAPAWDSMQRVLTR